ncbi:DUF262 domain-containing protein [Cyclobacterium qasimii]|uniref:GmrSD restriction endonucleases N-terminal domain-containing protein n=1 Tax=Cyclobacterium qasimii M12-11B TaxID=641524 RepID=S7WYL3_9BACT|nr:DUF262 domain-containing protein [Cyclobacterium qasimii]EPR69038.1 hypothetical protein ADICYQ_1930 [Cyclobacterium qasimii M12-11B]
MAKKIIISDRELEEQYEQSSFKLTQERSDFLLPQIVDFVKTKRWLNLHPEYQRRLVWDRKKKSLFIESLLLNIPVPPIFLFEWDYSRYEVMDGQQRLSSVLDFYDNKYKLTGLEQWSDLTGKSFSELPPLLKKALDRRRISATVILAESAKSDDDRSSLRRFVFERLNTGGQKLNAQELRNCLYSSLFNNLIVELAGNDLFDDIWEIPRYSDNIRGDQINTKLAENSLFKRMTDCEIVLRFFAFRQRSHVKGAVKKILDNCMIRNQSLGPDEITRLSELFISRLEAAKSIFGDRTFRIIDQKGKARLSQPLFDAVMVALDREYDHIETLKKKSKELIASLDRKLLSQKTYELVVGKLGTAPSIKDRADFMQKHFKEFI